MVFGAEYRIINSRYSSTLLFNNGFQNFSIPSAHIPQQNNDSIKRQDSRLVYGSRYHGIISKFI